MVDVVSVRVRSRMMAGIRAGDTQPELAVRSHLHRLGFRFRIAPRELPGRPDIVLPKWRTAVLVHGCFWHGHADCRYFRLPTTRRAFWRTKITSNMERDRRVVANLRERGWRVAVVWECALRDHRERSLTRLARFVESSAKLLEVGSGR